MECSYSRSCFLSVEDQQNVLKYVCRCKLCRRCADNILICAERRCPLSKGQLMTQLTMTVWRQAPGWT